MTASDSRGRETASEKLRALDEAIRDQIVSFKSMDAEDVVHAALPLIADVVEAAEPFRAVKPYGWEMKDVEALDTALTALRDALAKHRDPYGPIGHETC